MEINAAVVELYGLPPEQFVAARNQLAKAVRDNGDEPAAASIVIDDCDPWNNEFTGTIDLITIKHRSPADA